MENKIIKWEYELQSLKNIVRNLNLKGCEVFVNHNGGRKKQTYFLRDATGNTITGSWDYTQLNHFIMGYGKANNELKAQCETYAKDYNNLVGEVERLSRSNCELLEVLKEVTTFLNVLPKLRLANKQGFDECINIDGVTILENQCNAAITKAQSNTI